MREWYDDCKGTGRYCDFHGVDACECSGTDCPCYGTNPKIREALRIAVQRRDNETNQTNRAALHERVTTLRESLGLQTRSLAAYEAWLRVARMEANEAGSIAHAEERG